MLTCSEHVNLEICLIIELVFQETVALSSMDENSCKKSVFSNEVFKATINITSDALILVSNRILS